MSPTIASNGSSEVDLATASSQEIFLSFIDDVSQSLLSQLASFKAGSGLLRHRPHHFQVVVNDAISKAMYAVDDFKREVISATCIDEMDGRLGKESNLSGVAEEAVPNSPNPMSPLKKHEAAIRRAQSTLSEGEEYHDPTSSHDTSECWSYVGPAANSRHQKAMPSGLRSSTSLKSSKDISKNRSANVTFAGECRASEREDCGSPRASGSDRGSNSDSGGVSYAAWSTGTEVQDAAYRDEDDPQVNFERRQNPSHRSSWNSYSSVNGYGDTLQAESTVSTHHKVAEALSAALTYDADEEDDGRISLCINGVSNPNHPARLGWDLATMMLVLLDAMVLPFQMAYGSEEANTFEEVWLWLTTLFFASDIVMNFNTAYTAGKKDSDYEPGRLITERSRIARNYMRTWLPIDGISTVPWGKLSSTVTGGEGDSETGQLGKLTKVVKFVRFMRLMRMLRLAKLAAIWERIEAKCGSIALLQGVGLLRVLFVLVCICHWNACIWWMIGQPTSLFTEILDEATQLDWKEQPHWTTILRTYGARRCSEQLQGTGAEHCTVNGPLAEQWTWLERDKDEAYVFSFYWTLGVMRTMPAEITPVNFVERVYVMVFMFFAFSAFAICVAQITQTFFKFSERKRVFGDEMSQVRMHLRKLKVSDQLQMKVKMFLRHLYDIRRLHSKERQMIQLLPESIQQELNGAQLNFHLDKLQPLKYVSTQALNDIASVSEVLDVAPGDLLCVKGELATGCFVLIIGRLHVVKDAHNMTATLTKGWKDTPGIRTSKKGIPLKPLEVVNEEVLGDPDWISQNTVLAMLASSVLRIDSLSFHALLTSNPNLMDQQRQSKRISYSYRPPSLNSNVSGCDSYNHRLSDRTFGGNKSSMTTRTMGTEKSTITHKMTTGRVNGMAERQWKNDQDDSSHTAAIVAS